MVATATGLPTSKMAAAATLPTVLLKSTIGVVGGMSLPAPSTPSRSDDVVATEPEATVLLHSAASDLAVPQPKLTTELPSDDPPLLPVVTISSVHTSSVYLNPN